MMRNCGRFAFTLWVLFLFSVSVSIFAQPAKRNRPAAKALDLGDTDADLVFTPLAPCRIADTRSGGGILGSGVTRGFKVAGSGSLFTLQGGSAAGCGVPSGATSALLNFVAVSPAAIGNLKGSAYPDPIPATGSILNYQILDPALNIANAVAFPICDPTAKTCDFDIQLFANGGATHVVIDVLGYFRRFPKEETITAVVPGVGLMGGGTAGEVVLDVAFGGSGAASTVARSDHGHYAKTVLVSPVGSAVANGAALLAAMQGITDASAEAPYLVKIEPGVYDITGSALVINPNVDVEGSGEAVTTVRQSGGGAAVYVLGQQQLRYLTVESGGPAASGAIGLYVASANTRITHVTADVRGTGLTYSEGISIVSGASAIITDSSIVVTADKGAGIRVDDGSATVSRTSVTVTGSVVADGFWVRGGQLTADVVSARATSDSQAEGIYSDTADAVMVVTNSTFDVTGPSGVSGIFNLGGDLTLSDVTIKAAGAGGQVTGVRNSMSAASSGPKTVTIHGSRISAVSTEGAVPRGVYNIGTGQPFTVSVDGSVITGASNTLRNDAPSTMRVANSRLEGGATVGVTCALVVDENGVAALNTCP